MNPSGLNYIGNQDYRGYLNYLGSTGNQTAKLLIGGNGNLGFVNNQGQLTGGGVPLSSDVINTNNQLYRQYQSLLNPNYNAGANILGGSGANYAVAPPKLDLASIYNTAKSTAEGNVNPFYTKQLNDFVAQQAAAKQQQDIQRQFDLQNLQADLQNKLQANELSGQRTSQDVLANEQQAGIQADRQQVDQGNQFNDARIAQAKQLATQGLTTSGTGSQQVTQAQDQRNLTESRQAEDQAQARQAQELFKARTFEDLARSSTLSKASEAQGEKQSQINWDKFVQQQGFDLTNKQQELEQNRLQAVGQETTNQAKLAVNSFIQSLSNPAQRLAAAQAYAGAF